MEPPILRQATGYQDTSRLFQGIPGVETIKGRRIFVSFYANHIPGEGPGNYAVLCASDDCGKNWREELHVLPPDAGSRVYDPVPWLAPTGQLWFFWSQCRSEKLWDCFDGRAGVWTAVCNDPLAKELQWSTPRRIADGVMMNKPEVLKDGSWLLPVALWSIYPEKLSQEQVAMARPNILLSKDEGRSFELKQGPDIPGRSFDEHVVVELRDGTLWLLARTKYGIGQSFSHDGGTSWSAPEDSGLGGPDSRFALRRLKSGRLCLVNHQTRYALPMEKTSKTREKLTVWLSDDEGKSWYGRLLLDGRENVSYPDIKEGEDGFIYAVHDYERLHYGQILLSRFTERDISAGIMITPGSFAQMTVSALIPEMQCQK